MSETLALPIAQHELLARYITCEEWVRADNSIRQDAFIPPRDHNLSVTRHLGITEEQLWRIGHAIVAKIATTRRSKLCGRADISTATVMAHGLHVEAAPLRENSNHAHINRWPQDKPLQKQIAQRLAKAAIFSVTQPQSTASAAQPDSGISG